MSSRLNEELSRYSALCEERMHDILDVVDTSEINRESMSYSLFAGGKRLRPALCLASCEMLGGRAEDAVSAACALEMIHTYALIHDDLPCMDNDDFRRGKPSNHVAFGEANALLAGDGLLTLAFLVLSGCGCAGAVQEIAKGAFDMVTGQSYDLTESENPEMLETIHTYKTGAMIRASVLAGAACAMADEAEREALARFASAYGLLFQITDDILDVKGSREKLGKSIGKDAEEHKLTYVTHFGLAQAEEMARRTADEARAALDGFTGKASFFLDLIDFTLDRDH